MARLATAAATARKMKVVIFLEVSDKMNRAAFNKDVLYVARNEFPGRCVYVTTESLDDFEVVSHDGINATEAVG